MHRLLSPPSELDLNEDNQITAPACRYSLAGFAEATHSLTPADDKPGTCCHFLKYSFILAPCTIFLLSIIDWLLSFMVMCLWLHTLLSIFNTSTPPPPPERVPALTRQAMNEWTVLLLTYYWHTSSATDSHTWHLNDEKEKNNERGRRKKERK